MCLPPRVSTRHCGPNARSSGCRTGVDFVDHPDEHRRALGGTRDRRRVAVRLFGLDVVRCQPGPHAIGTRMARGCITAFGRRTKGPCGAAHRVRTRRRSRHGCRHGRRHNSMSSAVASRGALSRFSSRIPPCTRAQQHLEAEMRKQDRISQQHSQNPSGQQAHPPAQPHPDEKMTGKARDDQPSRPPRPDGKIPLPE